MAMKKLRNVNRSKVHEKLISQYAKDGHPVTGKAIFPTIKDLLCFCAMLGFSENKRTPLDRSQGVEDIMYEIFQRTHADDYIYMLALAASKDVGIFRDDAKEDFVEIFEEYANGGLEILKAWTNEFPDEYGDKALFQGLQKYGYLPSGTDVSPNEAISKIEF